VGAEGKRGRWRSCWPRKAPTRLSKSNEMIDGAVLDGRGRVQGNTAAASRAQGRRSVVAKAFY